jgi:hypothetical protein
VSNTKHTLERCLRNLVADAEFILHEMEAKRVPSYDLKGTFKVNAEVSLKKLQELRKEDLE